MQPPRMRSNAWGQAARSPAQHAGRPAARPPYRTDIDGLRALAVGGVILFHAGFGWCRGGYAGVDVFFVLSGYLITSIILHEQSRGAFSLARFYERRARRILPALLLVLLVTMAAAWRWLDPARMREFADSLVAVLTFSSNFFFWQQLGYFAHVAEETPLLHTWSLAVEEQFYILFPLSLMLAWRLGVRRIGWGIAVALLCSLALSEVGRRYFAQGNFYLVVTRAWELLAGAWLAVVMSRRAPDRMFGRRGNESLAACGVLMICASFVVYGPQTPFPSVYALLPTLGVLLVIGFGPGAPAVSRVLSAKPLVLLGLISYSAYLWHQPVFAFARLTHLQRLSSAEIWVLVGVTLVLAYASWKFVELPFRTARAVPRRQAYALFATLSVAFIGAGVIGHLSAGLPDRYEPAVLRLASTAVPSPQRAKCHTKGANFLPPQLACRDFHPKVSWAAFGDSHVVEPAYALAERLSARGEGLLQLSFSACPPALDFEPRAAGCSAWIHQSLEYLEASPEIRNVLINFRHTAYLFGHQQDAYPALPHEEPEMRTKLPGDAARELYWSSYVAIVERLLHAGKRVFVLFPVPELPREIDRYIFLDHAEGPITSRDYYLRRHQFVLSKLAALPWSERLVAVDPTRSLCDFASCRAVIDNTSMYFDDDHLSVSGARRVIASVFDDPAAQNPLGTYHALRTRVTPRP